MWQAFECIKLLELYHYLQVIAQRACQVKGSSGGSFGVNVMEFMVLGTGAASFYSSCGELLPPPKWFFLSVWGTAWYDGMNVV